MKDVVDNIYLTLKPYNGLGNRFRVLASTVVFAKHFNTELKLNWTSTRGFDDTPLKDLIDIDYFMSKYDVKLISNVEYEKDEKSSVLLHEKFNDVHEQHSQTHNKEISNAEKQKRPRYINDFFSKKWNKVAVRTSVNLLNVFQPEVDSIIPEGWILYSNIIKDIKPSKKVLSMSSQTLKKFGDNVLGVHIRRGDATNTDFYSEYKNKYSSDVSKYIKRTKELLNSKYKKVFVATDCKISLELFKKTFNDKCITYEKNFNESVWHKQKQGQLDARVEQHLLSCTDHLLTSEWSTFSDFAKNYSDLTSEIV